MTISKFDAMIDKMSIYRSLYNAPRTGPAVDYVWWVREREQDLNNALRLTHWYAKQDLMFYAGVIWEAASTGRLRIVKPSPSIAAVQQKERQMKRDETILTIGLLCACAFMTVALIWRLSVMP